eukprot:1155277-Pelagomonas_calceolata.AAC.2
MLTLWGAKVGALQTKTRKYTSAPHTCSQLYLHKHLARACKKAISVHPCVRASGAPFRQAS